MHKKVKNRLISIMIIFTISLAGVYLILTNLEDNIIFFYPPSDIKKIANSKTKIRVGGVVKVNSITKLDTNNIKFVITDYQNDLTIKYQGILPALFREKQGIIAEGRLIKNVFIANKLLAKHDEKYMPPEIQKNLK